MKHNGNRQAMQAANKLFIHVLAAGSHFTLTHNGMHNVQMAIIQINGRLDDGKAGQMDQMHLTPMCIHTYST